MKLIPVRDIKTAVKLRNLQSLTPIDIAKSDEIYRYLSQFGSSSGYMIPGIKAFDTPRAGGASYQPLKGNSSQSHYRTKGRQPKMGLDNSK